MWLLAFLEHADGRVVGDHGGQEASEQHLLQQMQRLLWLSALLACADQGRVDDLHGCLPAFALLAGADPGAVGDNRGGLYCLSIRGSVSSSRGSRGY